MIEWCLTQTLAEYRLENIMYVGHNKDIVIKVHKFILKQTKRFLN